MFFPTIISSPDEIVLESKNNSNRNFNINKNLSTISLAYMQTLKEYNIILKQRNAALKQNIRTDLWDTQLIEKAQTIWLEKVKYITKINIELEKIQKQYNIQNNTTIKIQGPETKSANIKEKLHKNIIQDKKRGRTSIGPHTDKVQYFLNDKEIKNKASQGERNVFFSILKKAEAEIIKKQIQIEPTILLDDVFAKLDSNNVEIIIDLFKNNKQTIITHTNKLTANKKVREININE